LQRNRGVRHIGIARPLPAFRTAAVEVRPTGQAFLFTCGMGMLRGTLVV